MEDIGRVVECFPAFGEVGLDREDAWLHLWVDLMPHELAVDKTQRGVGLEASRLMRVEVHGVIVTCAQDVTALGLPRFRTLERLRVMQLPGRERDAGR